MAVFLTILKWLGIILLAALVLVLVLILIALLVPFRYNARAAVDDPERHEEFPVSVLIERSSAAACVSWFFGAVKVLIAFPGNELITVKVFGRDIRIMDKLRKEETSLAQRVETAVGKAEKIINAVDYIHRVLTGSCGRRAWRKVRMRLLNIADDLVPAHWKISGNVGLGDPCLNGNLTGFTSILMPFLDEHLGVNTEWDLYRCDMNAQMDGKFRIITPVKEMVPLVFDKDCRKVLRKLKKVKSKLQ